MTSLQPREQGRARALSPLGCHCAADFQEALGPRRGWLGPLGGAGLLAGLPLPPPGWASRHTRGRIVPTAVPGPESTSGHCACAHRAWAEASVAARQPSRAAWQLPHPSLDPGPAAAAGRDGRRRPQAAPCSFLRLLACHLPRGALFTWTPLSFPRPSLSPGCPHVGPPRSWAASPYPPIVRRGKPRPADDLCRVYRPFSQNGQERGLGCHTGRDSTPGPVIFLLCDFVQVT